MKRYTKRGMICAAEFGTVVDPDAGTYAVRVEATERTAALLFALGVEFRYVDPREDSGRAWYEFPYSDQLDDALKTMVDFIGDVIYHQPTFGQMVLFDEDTRDG